MSETQQQLIEHWNSLDAEPLLREIFERHGCRAAIGTSFQKTGLITIDIACRVADRPRVFTVDTGRLFQETHDYMAELHRRFGIDIEVYGYDPQRMQPLIDTSPYGEYLFLESQAQREACCHARKVLPRNEALRTVDVWITGLRRSQSAFRSRMKKVELVAIEGRPIIKVSPLFDWSDQALEQYIEEHRLPIHPLYRQGYTTIGCTLPCTTPVLEGEDARAGRWRWEEASKKECTIHLDGYKDGAGI